MNSVFETGNNTLDAAIAWMITRAIKTTLRDGTVSYFFEGRLPMRMIRKIVDADEMICSPREVYNWNSELAGISFSNGSFISTQKDCKLTAYDYTVPANA